MVRKQILPFFPKDLVPMKSGRGIHETCNEVYINAYHNGLMKKYTLQRKLTTKWFHLPFGNTPEHLCTLLSLSKELVVTRNWQCRLRMWWTIKPTCLFPEQKLNARNRLEMLRPEFRFLLFQPVLFLPLRLELRLLILLLLVGFVVSRSCRRASKSNCSGPRLPPPSKALKENTNIAKRIAKMEELGQGGMTLLEKMREAIGPLFDEEYKARARALYADRSMQISRKHNFVCCGGFKRNRKLAEMWTTSIFYQMSQSIKIVKLRYEKVTSLFLT